MTEGVFGCVGGVRVYIPVLGCRGGRVCAFVLGLGYYLLVGDLPSLASTAANEPKGYPRECEYDEYSQEDHQQ